MKIGKAAGLSETTIEDLRCKRWPQDMTPDEAAALRVAAELLEGRGPGAVSEKVYEDALRSMGKRGVFEVVTISGFYSTLSRIVNTFQVPVPSGELRPFSSGVGSLADSRL